MTATVRQALEMWPLTQAQLLAGADGLDNELSWVHIVEVFDDPYFLSPRVLLCTTGYGFKDDPALQDSVMKEAARVGVAAILMKTGYELKTVPDDMLAAADRFKIPFLKLPQNVPFSDVTRAMAGLLLRGEAEALRRARQILRKLMESHASGGGFPEITRVLGDSLGCSTFVTNRRGEMLATYLAPSSEGTPSEGEGTSVSTVARLGHFSQRIGATVGLDRLFNMNKIVALPPGQGVTETAAFIAPIRFEGRMRGFVGVVRDRTMTDLTHWAIEAATLVAAAEYRALRVEELTEQRLTGSLLDSLCAGGPELDAQTLHRLVSWGYDAAKPCRIVLIEIDPGDRSTRREPSLEEARPLFELYCGSGEYEPVVRFLGPTAMCLRQTPDGNADREREELADLHARLTRHLRSARVWATAGRPSLLSSGLVGSHNEARRALAVVRRTRPDGGSLCAEDLGIDNVLLDLAGSERALDYARTVLGALLGDGRHHGGERLLLTLRTYLAEDSDTQATAERLFLHPNTVRYRLKTVEELTGLSLRSSTDRTLLTVALRLLELGDTGS